MKLILEMRHCLSSGDKLLYDVNVLFIGSLEPEAVMNHESLVGRGDKFLIDVGNATSGIRGVLERKNKLRIRRTPRSSHSRRLRHQTPCESARFYQHLTNPE